MATTNKALSAVEDYLAFLGRFRFEGGGLPDPRALAPGPDGDALAAAVRGQPLEVLAGVARRLSAGVVELPDPLAAAWAAIRTGGLVEDGVDPAPLAEALRARLPRDLAAARRFVERLEAEEKIESPGDADMAALERVAAKEPEGASAWAGLQLSTPAAMAVWSRDREARRAAKETPGLAEDASFLGSRGGACFYVGELLSAADGKRILVIAPEAHKGFEVELTVVRNAAHLFALLEDKLVGDPAAGLLEGQRTDPRVAAIARGEATLEEAMSFQIHWHYEYWYGLAPQGAARATGLHPLVAAMIGVEAAADDLPAFRGQTVILMRPALLPNRSCDVGFFAPLHDALRSGVTVVRRLAPSEVDALCGELEAEAKKIGEDGGGESA